MQVLSKIPQRILIFLQKISPQDNESDSTMEK